MSDDEELNNALALSIGLAEESQGSSSILSSSSVQQGQRPINTVPGTNKPVPGTEFIGPCPCCAEEEAKMVVLLCGHSFACQSCLGNLDLIPLPPGQYKEVRELEPGMYLTILTFIYIN